MRNVGLLVSALSILGCSNAPANDFPPPAEGIQIQAGPYVVPAHSEKYFCYTQRVTKDAGAIEVDVHNGLTVHHLAVFQTLSDEPEGFSECPSQIKMTWVPLYGGGRNTPGIKLPSNAAFKFPAGQQILVQLHLVNAGANDVHESTLVNLVYAKDPAPLLPAGIFALGKLSFDIPTGATNFPVVGQCNSPRDLDVFALFPHMHTLGKRIALEYGATESTSQTVYQVDPWSFGDQPMQLQTLNVKQGDFLRATCTYDNTAGHDVMYGESTLDEMCFMILFYTPFDHLNGCVQ